ncbi:hypothetical protein LIZ34_09895 [Intestinimonas butyriciproducens]|nr:hypothetical protein [Intestinimonas butyriciproducens]
MSKLVGPLEKISGDHTKAVAVRPPEIVISGKTASKYRQKRKNENKKFLAPTPPQNQDGEKWGENSAF